MYSKREVNECGLLISGYERMNHRRHVLLGVIVVAGLFAPSALGVRLEGRIVRVGFPGSGRDPMSQGSDFYRVGRWTPILVELTNRDGDLFTGSIEVHQPDRDGDIVVARRTGISVRESGRFHLYIPSGLENYGNRPRFSVQVYDEEGKPAPLFDEQGKPLGRLERETALVEDLSMSGRGSETRVILDISEQPVNLLEQLVRDTSLVRPVLVLRGSPVELPDLAAGLDMVDIVVWDGADPSKARDPAQLRALVEWVRQGGILVLGVGRNWELVGKSTLGELLPVELNGTQNLSEIPVGWQGDVLGNPDATATVPLNSALTYCAMSAAVLRADADSLVPMKPRADEPLAVTRRPCGRGEILLVGFELNELFKQTGKIKPFLQALFDLRAQTEQVDPQQPRYYMQPVDLFKYIEQLIGFQTTAGMYFLLAFLFVIAYILMATLGSWAWLKRRGLLRHAWVTFAGMVVLASGTSLLAVRVIRGFGQQVQEMSIVDGRAGSYDASAVNYFGLKTSSHLRLDLRVPSDWAEKDQAADPGGLLGPLAMEMSLSELNKYTVGERYQALASLGELREVPMRATLKQFEAVWKGQMTGRVTAALARDGDTPYLHKSSWITNELNTDLHDCHLLVPLSHLKTGQYSRARFIHVYPLGLLKDRQRLSIGDFEAEIIKQRRSPRSAQLDLDQTQTYRPERLTEFQTTWLKDHVRLQDYMYQQSSDQEVRLDVTKFTSALLLMTTFDEIAQQDMLRENQEICRSRGQRLDRSSLLRGDYALLLGFSDDPGPARLCWRRGEGKWRPVTPDQAHVMYRIEIPVSSR